MNREQGVSALELALMMPFLLMVTFGIVDIGRIMYFQMGVQEAVQEGAAYASIQPDDPNGIIARTVEAVSAPDLDPSSVTVTCPDSVSVTITATHVVPMLTPFVGKMIGAGYSASSSATAMVFSLDKTCVAS